MASNVQLFVLAGFAVATWAVSLAGIASAQNSCDDITGNNAGFAGINGFSASVLNCSKLFRYFWFVVMFEFVVILGLIIAVAVKSVRSQSASWIGMLAVATLLYIQATEAFLTGQDAAKVNNDTVITARTRTMVAGSIMTAVMNCFILIVLGIKSEDAETEKQPSVKADVI